MLRLVLTVLFLATCLLAGCAKREPDFAGATFRVWNEGWDRQTSYRIEVEGDKLLKAVLNRAPDSEVRAAVGLMPSGMLDIYGRRYAVEEDQIVFLGKNRTRIWNRPGVRDELIKKSTRGACPAVE